jgi:shikimate dehydrogenase
VRAVNTLRRRGKRWVACNTDVAGFLAPLQSVITLTGLRATVLGAGGAARAVGEALASAGTKLTFVARRPEQAQTVAAMTGASFQMWPPQPGSWDVLVNATPIGTGARDDSPLPNGPFTGQLVYDLVYNPTDTRLLREAHSAGCLTLGGLDMLVAQAHRQFEFWTDVRVPERVLRDAAINALNI